MENIIQQLKDNKKAFGLMSEEMQEKAISIGFHNNFRLYSGYGSSGGFGNIIDNPQYGHQLRLTYCLRADYEDEPEIRQMEIAANNSNCLCMYNDEGQSFGSIANVHERPDFIGFKFEDGQIWNSPINYSFGGRDPGFRTTVESIKTKGSVVLHATHVLFRRNKSCA